MDCQYDPLCVWIDDHNRLLMYYTIFYAWQRRTTLRKYLHTWIIRMHTYRSFRLLIPSIQIAHHIPHMRIIPTRRHNLPDQTHYQRLVVDYQMQRYNRIPMDQITFHPTPAINIILDLVENRYMVLPYTSAIYLHRSRYRNIASIR